MRVGRLGLGPLVEGRQRHCRRYVALAQPGINCQLQSQATCQDRWREGQHRDLSDPEKSQDQHGNPYSIRDGIARHSLRVHEEFCCFAQLLESKCALNDQCTLLAIAIACSLNETIYRELLTSMESCCRRAMRGEVAFCNKAGCEMQSQSVASTRRCHLSLSDNDKQVQ